MLRTSTLVTLFAALVFAAQASAQTGMPLLRDYVPGELIVKFKSGVRGKQSLSGVTPRVSAIKRFERLGVERWKLQPGESMAQAIAELQASGAVEFVEPNYRRYPRQVLGQGDYVGQIALTQIQVDAAADWITANAPGPLGEVVVAVIDDSVDTSHSALKPYIWTNSDEVSANGQDDDNNGYDDDVNGWDFVDSDNNPSPLDGPDDFCEDGFGSFSHGTMVSGALAAVAARVEQNGVTWPLRIMPLRIGCLYSVAHELKAVEYALANGARIVNASYGGPQFSLGEREAMATLAEENVLVVAAAGNFEGNNDRVPDYPSSLELPNILAVGATDVDRMLTDWSHYGQTSVDVAAPGENIITTTTTSSSTGPVSGYDILIGTSFSAPLVAGVAALTHSVHGYTAQEMKGAVMASVDPLANDVGLMTTDGQVNAAGAVSVSPQPVLVLDEVVVDDSLSGNGNGLLDPSETATLQLTILNEWVATSGTITGTLTTSSGLVSIGSAVATMAAVPQAANVSGDYQITLSNVTGHHEIPFTLRLESGTYSTERHFSVEVGTLYNDVPVSGEIHLSHDRQDEFHYYHIQVPAGTGQLSFGLTTESSGESLHLLVRNGTPPQFDYAYGYYAHPFDPAVNRDTYVGDSSRGSQTIVIPNPAAGTWYAVVLVDGGDDFTEPDPTPNVRYTLLSNYGGRKSSGGGCAVAPQAGFDPSLLLLALISAVSLVVRRARA